MASYITISLIFPVLTLAAIAAFFFYYWRSVRPRKGTLEWSVTVDPPPGPVSFSARLHPMARKDALPLLLITLAYAFTAFFQLGSPSAPQTFQAFGDNHTVEIELSQEVYLTGFLYYTGLGTGAYNMEISSDGAHWSTLWARKDAEGKLTEYYWADAQGYDPSYAVTQKYSELFKWAKIEPENPQNVRFLRITGRADNGLLNLGELALCSATGESRDPNGFLNLSPSSPADGRGNDLTGVLVTGGDALFDEAATVPDRSTWYNSAYFDEIYHARTALEHIEGVYPYEVSHPPLGKLILSLGIQLFGMTPFGWRFMGTLFGVLMLPVLYVFLKNLFGKTPVAACGTALFAFDFMHLTQTRIATIDTYGVFFILCMYFFMYRYLTLPADTPFRKGALPLFLSGLSFGLGAASKWTVIYAAAGLAVLYFIALFFRWRDRPRGEGAPKFAPWCVKTLLFSVLSFVLVPLTIYTASYLPYAQAKDAVTLEGAGESISAAAKDLAGSFIEGGEHVRIPIPTENLVGIMLENQRFMFTYHEGVHDAHPYSSRWYQWIVDGRPILYYLDNAATPETGLKAAFGCFNNPIVAWAGLLAIVSVGVQLFLRRCGKALFLLIGYLAQLVPWMIIGRTTFEYHYFPSTLFLVLAIASVFSDLIDRRPQSWKGPVYGLTGGAVALYFVFYPVLTGLAVPEWYTTNFLRWLPSWPF
ncbi:MAG: phospholipid carrier-dependent glycosyltransferase [Clostridia bacterium]|nr:phospholipid carrier-dependent glycosyltransferase [Clostridia bacterium]